MNNIRSLAEMRNVWNGLSKEAKCVAILLGYTDNGGMTVILHNPTRRRLEASVGKSVVDELVKAEIIDFVL